MILVSHESVDFMISLSHSCLKQQYEFRRAHSNGDYYESDTRSLTTNGCSISRLPTRKCCNQFIVKGTAIALLRTFHRRKIFFHVLGVTGTKIIGYERVLASAHHHRLGNPISKTSISDLLPCAYENKSAGVEYHVQALHPR